MMFMKKVLSQIAHIGLAILLCAALVTPVYAAGTTGSEAAPAAEASQETAEDELTLDRVIVLSRHNIRSPLSEKGSMIDEITPHEWFAWTSRPGELSLRGAMLETTMGQYFRLWLEKEGLFPENYIPEENAVRFYANGLQRTQATARYFSAGLLPVAVVPIEKHVKYGELDPVFIPNITFMNDAFEEDVREALSEAGGGEGLAGYRESLEDAMWLIMDVVDMEESEIYQEGKYGNFLEDETIVTFAEGDEPKMTGPIKTALSLSDALVLQYYEEADEARATFGHGLTEGDWKTIASVLSTYEDIMFGNPLLSVNQANPMLREIYSEMTTDGRKFSFLCGHDSTITSVLAALGVEEYELPGAIEPTTPIGVKVVFSRFVDENGEAFYQTELVYQSTEQLRSIQPLSLEETPMIVPITFEGVEEAENGLIPESDLLRLFEDKIEANEEMILEYEEVEEDLAA